MRSFPFLITALCILIGFSGCTEKEPDPEPVPVQAKTFTGCRLIKTVNSVYGNGTEYIYDSKNNIVKENSFAGDGTVGSYTTYDYDANGRVISSKLYDLSSSATAYTPTEYRYNSAGMLSSEVSYDQINTTKPLIEKRYSYDGSGKVDSSWILVNTSSSMKPQWLYTYAYDFKGNLLKLTHFSVQPNGNINSTPSRVDELLNYDNFKNPYSQKNFTLRQLQPISFFTKNNKAKILSDGFEEYNLINTYRADSLVSAVKNVELKWTLQFIYDCN
jgi:hypothetical protein